MGLTFFDGASLFQLMCNFYLEYILQNNAVYEPQQHSQLEEQCSLQEQLSCTYYDHSKTKLQGNMRERHKLVKFSHEKKKKTDKRRFPFQLFRWAQVWQGKPLERERKV